MRNFDPTSFLDNLSTWKKDDVRPAIAMEADILLRLFPKEDNFMTQKIEADTAP